MHGSVTEPNGRHPVNATLRSHLCTRGCNTLCSLPRAPCTPSPRARRQCRVGSSAGSHSSRSRSTGSRSSTPATVRRLQGRSRDRMSRFPGEEAVYNADAGLYWTLQILRLWHITVLERPCVRQVYQCYFSNNICFLCHISVTLTVTQTFYDYYICYGGLWSVIFDVNVAIALGHQAHTRQGTQ